MRLNYHDDLKQNLLETVVLKNLSLVIKYDGSIEETYGLRYYSPPVHEFIKNVVLAPIREMVKRTTGEEHRFYKRVLCMLILYVLFLPQKHIRTRVFNLETFDHSPTFKEIIKMKGLQSKTNYEKMIPIAGEIIEPPERLLQRAIFDGSPLNREAFDDPSYIKFRDNALAKWEERLGTCEKHGEDETRDFIAELKEENSGQERLLQAEAEDTYFKVIDYGCREIYRKIRNELSHEERRFFHLFWQGQPILSNRIPALDLAGVIKGMDDQLLGLILSVFVFKKREFKEELEQEWSAYTKLYPFWVIIQQDDEREEKVIKKWEQKTVSLQQTIAVDEEGNELTRESIIGNKEPLPDELMLRKLPYELIEKYTAGKQKDCLRLHYHKGLTMEEIASLKGISHQAINKHIKAGIKNIKKGPERKNLK